MTINKRRLFEWLVFVLIAFPFALMLALRPIPPVDSPNDTGRYVDELNSYCKNNAYSSGLINQDISYGVFYAATSPSCWVDSSGVFLFLVAAFVPLMFLLFSKWHNGASVWACGLLFSVYGLELMTNAMRQSFAMLLFFGSLALILRGRYLKLGFFLGILSVAAHTSALAFFPLLFWLAEVRFPKFLKYVMAVLFLCLVVVIALSRDSIAELYAVHDFYSEMYAEELNPSFILFMVLPLYFISGLRWALEKNSVADFEKKSLAYSTVLLLVVFVLYPTISYRYAIFAVPMQIFLVTISGRHKMKVAGIVMVGLLAHLSIMVFISNNYAVLIYG